MPLTKVGTEDTGLFVFVVRDGAGQEQLLPQGPAPKDIGYFTSSLRCSVSKGSEAKPTHERREPLKRLPEPCVAPNESPVVLVPAENLVGPLTSVEHGDT